MNTDDTANLYTLCTDLAEVESEIAGMEAQRLRLRQQIEPIAQRLGKTTLPGLGTVAITEPGKRVSWDTRALESLLAKLAANGYPQIAEELAAARRETATAASLRISFEKRGS